MSARPFPVWAVWAAGLILVLGACAPATETAETAAPETTEPPEVTETTEAPETAEEGQRHAGVEVNVLTFTGPQIAEPLQRRAPDFEALTGARINVVTVPFSDLYQKILTDLATGTNSFHAFVFAPQWMGDYVTPGYLEDLTDRVTADQELQWDDIAPFFRDFSATYGGRVYTIPLDGDFQMVYYRSDLLEQDGLEPPVTWDDYLAIAERYHGQDLNEDGQGDYGSCIAKKRAAQSYWMVWSVAGGFLQAEGTQQGSFFDVDTMAPVVNNEAFAAALDIYSATTQYGPPDELNLDVGDTRGLFTSGRCALSIDWGDIGTLAIDPETSVVQDKVGAVILPGTRRVLDRASGQLVDCDDTTCPHAVDGVNHAPYAAFGGWSGAINAAVDQSIKDAAYDFLSYMSAPEQANVDVTIGVTGFNPYRTSQFENIDLWVEAGMSEEAAQNYLGAIRDSLESPNMILDLRIPKTAQYQGVVLDTAIAQFLAGEISRDEAMAQIETGWNEITDAEGRDTQQEAYATSLSIER
ncbi:MAG: extracellular solute-binding protein [Actinomycetota bacterium]|nr:extracellular solute-binding protein [Actinomycetota bacterium]